MKKTVLLDKHVKLGAKIVDFAGWAMPIQYNSILAEAKAVRSSAGIFDISHKTINLNYFIIVIQDMGK